MGDKRGSPEDAGDDHSDSQLYRPRPRLSSQLADRDVISRLELDIRKWVSEEVEEKISHYLRSSLRSSIGPSDNTPRRDLQLVFIGKIKEPSYAGSKIETENSIPVRVVLMDACSKKVTFGSLSSLKVDLVALKGNIKFDVKDNWTKEEFSQGIARERVGRRPLVIGDVTITLKNGECDVNNVIFTDNSRWLRGGKFRLGAKVSGGPCGRERIREAISEAFTVRDQRGESYQKHHPPRKSDKVWRLEGISRDGKRHAKLDCHKIYTVEDFLKFHSENPTLLRCIIGNGAPLSDKVWYPIIKHAETCIADDDQNYVSPEKLNRLQKDIVEKLKQQACPHPTNLLQDEAVTTGRKLLMNKEPEPLITPIIDGPADQGIVDPSTTYAFRDVGINQFVGSSTEPSSSAINEFSLTHTNSFRMPDAVGDYTGNNWVPSCSQGIVLPSDHPTAEDISQAHLSAWSPNNATWGNVFDMVFSSDVAEVPEFDNHINTGIPSTGWFKICAAVKWGISLRKNVAAKRKMAPLPFVLQA